MEPFIEFLKETISKIEIRNIQTGTLLPIEIVGTSYVLGRTIKITLKYDEQVYTIYFPWCEEIDNHQINEYVISIIEDKLKTAE